MYVLDFYLPEEMGKNSSQMPERFILHLPILAPAGYTQHVTINSTYSNDFTLQHIIFV